MLAALAAVYPVALLSNKGEKASRRILEGLGLAPHFRLILGGDSLPTRKPDPAGLRLAAGRLGVPVEELMLIGDTRIDGETARAAGALFGLVEWGFPPSRARRYRRRPAGEGACPSERGAPRYVRLRFRARNSTVRFQASLAGARG
jgi:phosphoglycolate phosphatase-like HAD superfamily hydrolase